MWWKKKIDLLGAVYYPGALVPSLESLEGLAVDGLEVQALPPRPNAVWSATLHHAKWGSATIHAQRESSPPPAMVVDYAPTLTDDDRARAKRAGASIGVSFSPSGGDVLRDRKVFLRFLSALLGHDGIVAVDAAAQHLWSRARLDDELAHDAPLDITQIHVLHCVGDRPAPWVHSHGLAEIGFVDFDVLRPHESVTGEQFDLLRALAFAIVEGKAEETITLAFDAQVDLVDVGEFTRRGAPADVALRDAEDHSDRRRVACDPKPTGFFGRLFRGERPRVSSVFTKGIDPTRQLVLFSTTTTDLVAARARETIGVLDALREEFAFLEPKPLVKLGYPTDGAENESDREHLWFEVNAVRGDRVDATLLNQPFRVSRLTEGQRGEHDLALLSDWTLMTPVGLITPRSLDLARSIREKRSELEALAARVRTNRSSRGE